MPLKKDSHFGIPGRIFMFVTALGHLSVMRTPGCAPTFLSWKGARDVEAASFQTDRNV